MAEPRRLVVLGTATEVGKTWVTCRLVSELAKRGQGVAARKPVQSFDPGSADPTDAELLAAASGEPTGVVCAEAMSFEVPMAPPMAAEVLGRPMADLERLIDAIDPGDGDLTVIEAVGGVLSPISTDAHSAGLARALQPATVLLVADAGLGMIDAVRSAALALAPLEPMVLLNRFDPDDDLHRRNRAWLADRDRIRTWVDIGELASAVLAEAQGTGGAT